MTLNVVCPDNTDNELVSTYDSVQTRDAQTSENEALNPVFWEMPVFYDNMGCLRGTITYLLQGTDAGMMTIDTTSDPAFVKIKPNDPGLIRTYDF